MLDAAEIGQLHERVLLPVTVVATGAFHRGPLHETPLEDFTADPPGSCGERPWARPVPVPGGPWLTVDFGQLTNSHRLLLLDADAGTVVDLAASDDLDVSGNPVVAPRHYNAAPHRRRPTRRAGRGP